LVWLPAGCCASLTRPGWQVLRDERLNREEEGKKRKRLDETESESRTQLLRAKRASESSHNGGDEAGAGVGGGSKQPAFLSLTDKFSAPESAPRIEGGGMPLAVVASGGGGEQGHKGFSIFAGMEHELAAAGGNETAHGAQNKDAVEDKRKEKEKFDRQWGLVGLGQDSITGQTASAKPWYASAQAPEAASFEGLGQAAKAHGSVPFGIDRSAAEKAAKEARKKAKADPAGDMMRYLAKTRRHKEEKKKHKHDKDRHGHKDLSRGKDRELSDAEKRAKLEKLRAERLAREAAERARVAQIMGGGAALPPASSSGRAGNHLSDDYRSGYSSGFASFHGGLVRDRHQGRGR
jgi:hypothetical protein